MLSGAGCELSATIDAVSWLRADYNRASNARAQPARIPAAERRASPVATSRAAASRDAGPASSVVQHDDQLIG